MLKVANDDVQHMSYRLKLRRFVILNTPTQADNFTTLTIIFGLQTIPGLRHT